MQQRPLGRTGLSVTPVGLGLAALGRPGYLNLGHGDDLPDDRGVADLRRRTHQVLDRAFDLGVRYVDVARSYGRGEEFLGSWLDRSGRAGALTVASKWGYTYTADWRVDAEEHEVKDHSLATFRRQWEETRAALGDRVGLYQVHSATLDSGVLDDDDVLDALTDLAGTGVAVGLTLSGPRQAATLSRALEIARAGRAPFTAVQATWNVLEPSVGPALQEAHDAGWGVIVKEGVANGRLTPRGDPPAAIRRIADEHGVGVDAVALAAALAQPFTTVALSGAATVAHLEDNLRALEVTLGDDDLDALAAVAEAPSTYWRTRSGLAWT